MLRSILFCILISKSLGNFIHHCGGGRMAQRIASDEYIDSIEDRIDSVNESGERKSAHTEIEEGTGSRMYVNGYLVIPPIPDDMDDDPSTGNTRIGNGPRSSKVGEGHGSDHEDSSGVGFGQGLRAGADEIDVGHGVGTRSKGQGLENRVNSNHIVDRTMGTRDGRRNRVDGNDRSRVDSDGRRNRGGSNNRVEGNRKNRVDGNNRRTRVDSNDNRVGGNRRHSIHHRSRFGGNERRNVVGNSDRIEGNDRIVDESNRRNRINGNDKRIRGRQVADRMIPGRQIHSIEHFPDDDDSRLTDDLEESKFIAVDV